jgi:cytoskeletal protein CcmA (bactofilin family)
MFNQNKRPDGATTFGTPPAVTSSAVILGAQGGTNHSIVDERLTMKGDLESDGDILVKGKVVGNIRCKLLIVDTDATIEGGIDAEEAVVRGSTRGKIKATRVRLEKTANVDSEIFHQSFSAEEGARIKGALRFMDDVSAPTVAAAAE